MKTCKIARKECPVLGTVTTKGCPVPLLSIKMMSDERERELGAQSAEKWKWKGDGGMKYDKIMAGGNLENIMTRLNGCRALLYLLYESAGVSAVPEDAISGVCDLLEMICRDFQADIDGAEDYTGKGAVV